MKRSIIYAILGIVLIVLSIIPNYYLKQPYAVLTNLLTLAVFLMIVQKSRTYYNIEHGKSSDYIEPKTRKQKIFGIFVYIFFLLVFLLFVIYTLLRG